MSFQSCRMCKGHGSIIKRDGYGGKSEKIKCTHCGGSGMEKIKNDEIGAMVSFDEKTVRKVAGT